MRELLVVSEEALPTEILRLLKGKSWQPVIVASQDAVIRRAGRDEALVGLACFPQQPDPEATRECCQAVFALPKVKWIGAMRRQDLSDVAIKRFVAERLYDFQIYPLHGERLLMAIGHAFGMATIEREFQVAGPPDWPARFGIIGSSAVMQEHFRLIEHAAVSDVPVLITGPTGTGKEKAARAIHEHSARARGPFVALNCAAIPQSLLQAELFGHVKGAFTGAVDRKMGHIATAAGGTLLLDEIGDMPLESQATLLRFLEDKIVTPLGATRGKEVDVRVIVSTNKNLEEAIEIGEFRADLYYRLAVLVVRTPPLSSREGDIERLAHFYLREAADALSLGTDLSFSREAVACLYRHPWPGNIRELRSCVYQAAMRCSRGAILPEHLGLGFEQPSARHEPVGKVGSLQQARNESERRRLEASLARNGLNISKTAKELNISRMTLYRLLEKHGLSRGAG